MNNDLWNRPQLIQGQTLKLALRNIVVYLPIYRLSVFTNVTLSKGIPPSIVLSNQRINLSLQSKDSLEIMGFTVLMVWRIKGGWAKMDKLSEMLGLGVLCLESRTPSVSGHNVKTRLNRNEQDVT